MLPRRWMSRVVSALAFTGAFAFTFAFVSAAVFALVFAFAGAPRRAVAERRVKMETCGMSPDDWCPSPKGDPCGRHKNVKACRADRRCKGMPYRGESVVACQDDGTGFAKNCPTVGCISR